MEIHQPATCNRPGNVRFLASVGPGLHLLSRGPQAALSSSPGRKLVHKLRLLVGKGDKAEIPSPAPPPTGISLLPRPKQPPPPRANGAVRPRKVVSLSGFVLVVRSPLPERVFHPVPAPRASDRGFWRRAVKLYHRSEARRPFWHQQPQEAKPCGAGSLQSRHFPQGQRQGCGVPEPQPGQCSPSEPVSWPGPGGALGLCRDTSAPQGKECP